jgi:single-strand DNA-binding protein
VVGVVFKHETGETMTVNKAILVGNLGADPEVRTTGGGTTVANLRLATTHQRKDRDGNWNNQTEWHSIVVFGRTAENIGKYCKKGKQLFVEGRIETEKWQDKETGKDRYKTVIIAENVRFLGGRSEGASSGPGDYGSNQSGGYGNQGGGNQGGGNQGGSNQGGGNQGGGNQGGGNQGGGNQGGGNQGGGNQDGGNQDGGGMPYRDDEIPF